MAGTSGGWQAASRRRAVPTAALAAPAAPAAPAAAVPGGSGQVTTLVAAAEDVTALGEQAGPARAALLGALRRMQGMQGLERQARGLSLASDVERAVAAGELSEQVQERVRPTLLAQTDVDDVSELADVLAVRPASAGPEGLALLRSLRALGTTPDPTRTRALLAQVRSGPDRGALTTAVRDVAVPVLERAAR